MVKALKTTAILIGFYEGTADKQEFSWRSGENWMTKRLRAKFTHQDPNFSTVPAVKKGIFMYSALNSNVNLKLSCVRSMVHNTAFRINQFVEMDPT